MISLFPSKARLNVLCLGAHPDDIEIGCGGALLVLAGSGRAVVRSMVLSGSGERPDEARAAGAAFGVVEGPVLHEVPDGRFPEHWGTVKQHLEDAGAQEPTPDVIFAPREDDSHQDHRLIAGLVTTVWRDSLVLRYEIPKWDGDLGRVTHYVPLTEEQARSKVELLHRSFPSQHGRDWWDEGTYLGLMRLRGVECRSPYAEGFVVSKARISFDAWSVDDG